MSALSRWDVKRLIRALETAIRSQTIIQLRGESDQKAVARATRDVALWRALERTLTYALVSKKNPPVELPTTLTEATGRYWVDILEAKPNPMFTEEQRAAVRFLRYSESVRCAECGKKRKLHWTLLCSFHAKDLRPDQIIITAGGKAHPPLTPVCSTHLLIPAKTKPE